MAATDGETQAQGAQDDGGQDPKHDEGYKYILSKAANFLHFLKKYFNVPWIDGVTVDDIERVDKSFITQEYRRLDSDLIYKLKKDGADIYFYVLLELQSTVDNTMVFRLLRYMVELLNNLFQEEDENVRERKDFRLPAIVPIVLYDGDNLWTAAKSFKEYTKNHDIFGDNIIDFKYLLFDLKRTDDENILPVGKLLDAAFSLAKMRLEKKLSPERMTSWLAEQTPNLSKDDISELADWMTLALKAPPEINKIFEDTLKKGDAATMKTGFELWADEYRGACVLEGKREGKREGMREGKREGMREGKREGMREGERKKAFEIAAGMRAADMDVDTISKLTGLTIDEILKL